MADQGLIIDVDYNITKAEAKANKLNRAFELSKQKAENIKKEIQALNDELERSKAREQEYTSEAEKLHQRAIQYQNDQLQLSDEQLKIERKRYDELAKLIDKEQDYQRNKEKAINSENINLEKQINETENIGEQIAINSKQQFKFAKSFEKSSKSAGRFAKRVKSLIASALFFSLITKAFTALRNEFGKLITESGTKTASLVEKLNGSLTVLGRTLYETIRPQIEWILEKTIEFVNYLTYAIAGALGKDVDEMKRLAEQTKKTGEEAKKATAGFDTLQTINSNESEENQNIDFSGLSEVGEETKKDFEAILATVATIIGVITLIKVGVAAWPVAIAGVLLIAGAWIDRYKDKIDKWMDGLPGGIYDIVHFFITTAYSAWDTLKNILKGLKEILTGDWKTGLTRIGIAIVNSLVYMLNTLIDATNLALIPIRGIIYGIAKLSGSDLKLKDIAIPHVPLIEYPKLATGAVLPGGSPMLAWVNDQPKGQPYVEGSIDNIAAAFEKYLGSSGLGNQNITIEAKGNWAQFIKWMNLQIKQENKRASIF